MNDNRLDRYHAVARLPHTLVGLLAPILLLAILLFGLSHATQARPAEQVSDLVPNWGFEQPSPANWYHGDTILPVLWWYYWSTSIHHNGGHSVEILNNVSQYTGQWWSDFFTITPGVQYDFSGWIRASSVQNGARIMLAFHSSPSETALVAQYPSPQVSGTRNWVRVEGSAVAPTNAHYARVYCDLIGRGTVWFDDVFVGPTPPKPIPVISKSGYPDPVEPGQSLIFKINYSNIGDITATQVIITETYDANVQFYSADPSPEPGSSNRVWRMGALGPNVNNTILVTVTVDHPLPDGTLLRNSVEMAFSGTVPVSSTVAIRVTSRPRLSIGKRASADIAEPGEYITYTIAYSNTGTAVAHGTRITDILPISVSYQSASDVPSVSGNTLVWEKPDSLDVEVNKMITVTTRVKSSTDLGDWLCNQIWINCDEGAPGEGRVCTRIPRFSVSIWPEYVSTVPLSQTVCYLHQVYLMENEARLVSVRAASSRGWTTTVDSPFFDLQPRSRRTVTACVTTPPDYRVISGTVDTVVITASLVISPDQAETVRDTVTIGRILDVILATPLHGSAVNWSGQYPQRFTFVHTITNTGNYTDGFDLQIDSDPYTGTCSPNMVQITPMSRSVGPGASFPVTGRITVDEMTPTCRAGFRVTSHTFPQTSTVFADEVGFARYFYLPLVLKTYHALCNGGFETGNFTCWKDEGELARSVQTRTVYAGSYSALLGNPDYACQGSVPVGTARIVQNFSVPSCPDPLLRFNYWITSNDKLNDAKWDSFDIYVNDTRIVQDGNTDWERASCDRQPWSSGWRSSSHDLSAYAGQNISVSFNVVSRKDGWYNTWAYVDQVEVNCGGLGEENRKGRDDEQ